MRDTQATLARRHLRDGDTAAGLAATWEAAVEQAKVQVKQLTVAADELETQADCIRRAAIRAGDAAPAGRPPSALDAAVFPAEAC